MFFTNVSSDASVCLIKREIVLSWREKSTSYRVLSSGHFTFMMSIIWMCLVCEEVTWNERVNVQAKRRESYSITPETREESPPPNTRSKLGWVFTGVRMMTSHRAYPWGVCWSLDQIQGYFRVQIKIVTWFYRSILKSINFISVWPFEFCESWFFG